MATNSAKRGTSLSNPKAISVVLLCLSGPLIGCDAGTEAGQGVSDSQNAQRLSESRRTAGGEAEDALPRVQEPDWEEVEREAADDPGDAEQGDTERPRTPSLADQPVHRGPLGGARPAPVTLPSGYDPAVSWPLVMLLHGYSVNGFLQDYYLGLSERVDSHGYILVVPEGTVDSSGKQFWNATPGCCNWYGSTVDDASYLVGLLEEALSRYNVDTSRVVLIGHSNGGYMSHRLACDYSELVTGIASIAGTSYADMDSQCEAVHPVSVLQIHGTLDATVAYEFPFAGVGAEATAAWWESRNGCEPSTSPPPEDYDATIVGDETQVTLATGCGSGTWVGLWRMNGTAHIPLFSDHFTDDVLELLLANPRTGL